MGRVNKGKRTTTMKINWNAVNKPLPLGIIVFFLMMVRVILFYIGSEERLIGIIPDDAFYYIQLAKHRVIDGFWTFDGTSLATGFHLFHGYFLAAIFLFLPNIEWQGLYLIIATISSISLSISAFLIIKLIGQLFDRKVQFMGVVPFLTLPVFIQSTSLMESWAVVLFSTLSLYVVFRKSSTTSWTLFLLIFLVGMMGSLARTDYGLIAGVLFSTSLLLNGFKRQTITNRVIVLLAGAILGLTIALLHNYVISGNFLQASAQIKLHWSSFNGHSLAAPLHLITKSVMHIFPGIALFLVFTMVAGALIVYSILQVVKVEYGGIRSERSIVFFACLLTLIGYIFVYRHNSEALQLWYAANFVAPIGVTLAGIAFYALNKLRFLVSSIAFLSYLTSALFIVGHIPHSHQSVMMKSGLYLKDMSDDKVYAAWNAGIISYFSGKPLVNLDGLTNDDAVPYILSNRLFDYIIERKIDYIVDFSDKFNERSRTLGGYDDWRIESCIREQIIDDNSVARGSSIHSLFVVDIPCQESAN
jgi:hypothetical protein